MTTRRPPDDAELIERLSRLSGDLAWPSTSDVAARVMATLERDAAARGAKPGLYDRLRVPGRAPHVPGAGSRWHVGRSLVLAILVVLAIAAAVAAVGLGVPGIRIEFGPVATPPASAPGPASMNDAGAATPTRGTASASPTVSASPAEATPPGQELGALVTLDQARADAGFGVLVPAAPGHADGAEVHLAGVRPFTRVTLRYPDGTMLTEFLGKLQPDAFEKMVGGGTTVVPVKVGTSDGWWISGAPHDLMLAYVDPDGLTRWREVTVSGNVLLWQVGDVTLRLETPLGEGGALEIATSVR